MKLAILVEMVVLWGAPVLMNAQPLGGLDKLLPEPWFLKHALAVIILMTILLTLADLGAGAGAMLFGLLVTVGYLLGAAGSLGPTLKTVTEHLV